MTRGERLAKTRKDAGLTQRQLAETLGIKSPYLSQIESGKRGGGRELWLRAAAALGVGVDYLLTGARAANDALHIPIALEFADGSVKDQGPRQDPAPRQELVHVACAAADWRAMRVSQAARIDLGAAAYDLRAGDLLILAPAAGAPPQPGTLVVATESRRGGEGGVVRPRQLRVIAPGPDGRTWLWPLQGAGQPTAAEPLEPPWEIVEVAIEQRRRLWRIRASEPDG